MCIRDSSKDRREMRPCQCRSLEISDNQERWKKMFDEKGFKEGQALLRFRGDMSSGNTTMRDPALFRINQKRHARLEQKYKVWPTYDFSGIILDSLNGVTHAMRSKEFELRKELHKTILEKLGLPIPEFIFFGRLDLVGMPVSKTELKPLIENGKIPWYDDPRLPTLEGLRRRGIRPEAVRKFILSLGLTKNDTNSPFDSLEAFNRKIIDSSSIRLNMIKNPKKLLIDNLPNRSIELQNHPTIDLGKRVIAVGDTILISEDDLNDISVNDEIRLMSLGNVKITGTGSKLSGQYAGDELKDNVKKIQWISDDTAHKIKIIIPKQLFTDDKFNEDSLQTIQGFTEPHYLKLKDNDEIQFIRFGYCRKESSHQAIFTHK